MISAASLITFYAFLTALAGLIVFLGIYWLVMLYHAATHNFKDKPFWVLITALGLFLGAAIYHLFVYRYFPKAKPLRWYHHLPKYIFGLLVLVGFGLPTGLWLKEKLTPPPTYEPIDFTLPTKYQTIPMAEAKSQAMEAIDKSQNLAELEGALNQFMQQGFGDLNTFLAVGAVYILRESAYENSATVILNEYPERREVNLFTRTENEYGFRYAEPEDLEELKKYSLVFVEEISLYPVDLIKKLIGNFEFIIVKDSRRFIGTDPFAGLTAYYIYLEYPYIEDEAFARAVIHHEIGHMFEQEGILRKDHQIAETGSDLEWQALNPESFEYLNKIVDGPEHPMPGFVSTYAQRNAAEDKAETFAYLMTNGYRERLKEWLKTDPILREKVNYLLNAAPDLKSVVAID